VFHVMNRAVDGLRLFHQAADYDGFVRVLSEAGQRYSLRLLAYCVMPNHWHLVVQPTVDRELSQYMQWLTATHAQRWRSISGTSGRGAVYQGRFRWVPVEADLHFLRLCLYVERNPVRAQLTTRAEQWRWSSAWQRNGENCSAPPLAEWPVLRPADWNELLKTPPALAVADAISTCLRRGLPYGSREWSGRTAALYGLPERPRGRPARLSVAPPCRPGHLARRARSAASHRVSGPAPVP
jgi:putative transposase